MKETRKQKEARQRRAAAERAADKMMAPIHAAIDRGDLVVGPASRNLCAAGCGYPVASKGTVCGECSCEDDCAIW